jgi:hypothetical protein
MAGIDSGPGSTKHISSQPKPISHKPEDDLRGHGLPSPLKAEHPVATDHSKPKTTLAPKRTRAKTAQMLRRLRMKAGTKPGETPRKIGLKPATSTGMANAMTDIADIMLAKPLARPEATIVTSGVDVEIELPAIPTKAQEEELLALVEKMDDDADDMALDKQPKTLRDYQDQAHEYDMKVPDPPEGKTLVQVGFALGGEVVGMVADVIPGVGTLVSSVTGSIGDIIGSIAAPITEGLTSQPSSSKISRIISKTARTKTAASITAVVKDQVFESVTDASGAVVSEEMTTRSEKKAKAGAIVSVTVSGIDPATIEAEDETTVSTRVDDAASPSVLNKVKKSRWGTFKRAFLDSKRGLSWTRASKILSRTSDKSETIKKLKTKNKLFTRIIKNVRDEAKKTRRAAMTTAGFTASVIGLTIAAAATVATGGALPVILGVAAGLFAVGRAGLDVLYRDRTVVKRHGKKIHKARSNIERTRQNVRKKTTQIKTELKGAKTFKEKRTVLEKHNIKPPTIEAFEALDKTLSSGSSSEYVLSLSEKTNELQELKARVDLIDKESTSTHELIEEKEDLEEKIAELESFFSMIDSINTVVQAERSDELDSLLSDISKPSSGSEVFDDLQARFSEDPESLNSTELEVLIKTKEALKEAKMSAKKLAPPKGFRNWLKSKLSPTKPAVSTTDALYKRDSVMKKVAEQLKTDIATHIEDTQKDAVIASSSNAITATVYQCQFLLDKDEGLVDDMMRSAYQSSKNAGDTETTSDILDFYVDISAARGEDLEDVAALCLEAPIGDEGTYSLYGDRIYGQTATATA